MDAQLEATIRVAEQAAEVLRRHGAEALVIGAMALAVHHYPRETEDFDLAVAVPSGSLKAIADELRAHGWSVELRLPDAEDPLGGVIDIRAPGADLVQIVNFDNSPAGGFPRLVRDSLSTAEPFLPGRSLKVVDLASLIAFKLYAGGPKSSLDILELLDRNPVDLSVLRRRCGALGLDEALERVLELSRRSS